MEGTACADTCLKMPNSYSQVFIALFLSLGLIVSPGFAEYGGGSGTAGDPYLISTAEYMNQIGTNSGHWDANFAMTADVDLGGYTGGSFNIIGNIIQPFTGTFDGRGHVISNFTYIAPRGATIGLFVAVGSGGVIKNLGIENCNIESGPQLAALCAIADKAIFENCWVQGGNIIASQHTTAALIADANSITVKNCYSLNISISGPSKPGGLIASSYESTYINCFTASSVFGPGAGAFTAEDINGIYAGCFWDSTVSDQITGIGNISDPAGLVGKPTIELQQAGTFIDAHWQILSSDCQPQQIVWRLCDDGADYPKLAVQYDSADMLCPDGLGLADLSLLSGEWLNELLNIPVDFKVNYHVDFADWSVLASAYGSAIGSPGFNPTADIAPAGGDGVIDSLDVAAFLDNWLADGAGYLNADINTYNGDGRVNFTDFAEFVNQFSN